MSEVRGRSNQVHVESLVVVAGGGGSRWCEDEGKDGEGGGGLKC